MEISLQAIDDLDGRTIINPTELRTNRHYVVYYNFVTKTLLTELFPYVSLIFFNVCIFREIRRSVEIQKAMRCTQSQKEEIKSANVVVSQFTVLQNYSKSRIFQFWHFSSIFVHLKLTGLVTLIDRNVSKLSHLNLSILAVFTNFCQIKNDQSGNTV